MKRLYLLFSMCLLSGCAGMKSSFDCNATAQDSCMTMEEANKKAQSQSLSAPGKKVRPGTAGSCPPARAGA